MIFVATASVVVRALVAMWWTPDGEFTFSEDASFESCELGAAAEREEYAGVSHNGDRVEALFKTFASFFHLKETSAPLQEIVKYHT